MPPGEFRAPDTVDDALAELAGGDALPVGGGTSVAMLLKNRLVEPARLVYLGRIAGLGGVREAGDRVRIGATTTLRSLCRSPLVRAELPALAEAAARVGNPRVRSVATLGGGLVHGDPRQDVPPALLALDAEVAVTGPAGRRVVPMREFGQGLMATVVGEDELVTEVLVPRDPLRRMVYRRFTPGSSDDYPTVGVAVSVSVVDGVVADARIALGGVAGTAVLATRAAAVVRTGGLTEDMVREAAAVAAEEVRPLADHRGSAEYKRAMVQVWVGRALRALRPVTARPCP